MHRHICIYTDMYMFTWHIFECVHTFLTQTHTQCVRWLLKLMGPIMMGTNLLYCQTVWLKMILFEQCAIQEHIILTTFHAGTGVFTSGVNQLRPQFSLTKMDGECNKFLLCFPETVNDISNGCHEVSIPDDRTRLVGVPWFKRNGVLCVCVFVRSMDRTTFWPNHFLYLWQ